MWTWTVVHTLGCGVDFGPSLLINISIEQQCRPSTTASKMRRVKCCAILVSGFVVRMGIEFLANSSLPEL